MFSWHWCSRLLAIVAIVGAGGVAPVSAQPAPPLPSAGAASLLPPDVTWVVNFDPIAEHSAPVEEGDESENWYRTPYGDYLTAAQVRLARPPTRMFSGRWIDVDLREPAMLVAYDGDQPVLTPLTIHGAGPRPTPIGVFTISRRVAD